MKTLLAAILLFVLVNTRYFWETKVSVLLLPLTLLIAISGLIILLLTLRKAILFFRYKEKNNLAILLSLVLLLCLLIKYPEGIIDFRRFESPTTLKAYREGVGGGGDMLYLREDSTFIDRYVMFGIDEQKGRYRIANDTIFFNSDEIKIDYGLIDSVSIRCHLKGHPQGKEILIYKIIKE